MSLNPNQLQVSQIALYSQASTDSSHHGEYVEILADVTVIVRQSIQAR